MGLGEEHDGIVELPERCAGGHALSGCMPGIDDPVIEIAVTPNRGDALGCARHRRAIWRRPVIGTAEAVGSAAGCGGRGRQRDPRGRTDFPARKPARTSLGRTVRGVRNGPSPAWLQPICW